MRNKKDYLFSLFNLLSIEDLWYKQQVEGWPGEQNSQWRPRDKGQAPAAQI